MQQRRGIVSRRSMRSRRLQQVGF
uniref:Uncharacterized protein n=1 Tax=Nelumbo nucifera TaxID=4432 RepID=A0A822XDF6_NELNU|nr:TPA_asm: hypothetical protein HUJ06_019823 [Nelumbo nucifera]